MVRARVTTKGQITIPVQIRRRYKLEPGSIVDFVAEERGARLVPLKRRALLDLYGALPATKPYRGQEKVRRVVGRKLGEELTGKARRT
ncbi:MAG: AbrB/MazE/SpoVT family DNA-binding domain-containing protein [Chloroflexi bacterium]|nr:AbrB/MazE/SpoVT family DNA-binding domain-containing protein [Chloroflexota bacterium]